MRDIVEAANFKTFQGDRSLWNVELNTNIYCNINLKIEDYAFIAIAT